MPSITPTNLNTLATDLLKIVADHTKIQPPTIPAISESHQTAHEALRHLTQTFLTLAHQWNYAGGNTYVARITGKSHRVSKATDPQALYLTMTAAFLHAHLQPLSPNKLSVADLLIQAAVHCFRDLPAPVETDVARSLAKHCPNPQTPADIIVALPAIPCPRSVFLEWFKSACDQWVSIYTAQDIRITQWLEAHAAP